MKRLEGTLARDFGDDSIVIQKWFNCVAKTRLKRVNNFFPTGASPGRKPDRIMGRMIIGIGVDKILTAG
jgi:hypothetical protein